MSHICGRLNDREGTEKKNNKFVEITIIKERCRKYKSQFHFMCFPFFSIHCRANEQLKFLSRDFFCIGCCWFWHKRRSSKPMQCSQKATETHYHSTLNIFIGKESSTWSERISDTEDTKQLMTLFIKKKNHQRGFYLL